MNAFFNSLLATFLQGGDPRMRIAAFFCRTMNLPHVAALLLIGWYLMIPSRSTGAPNEFDDHAALSRWFVFSSHDTAHECEEAKFLNRGGHKQPNDPMQRAFEQAQCIASDDPRLAK